MSGSSDGKVYHNVRLVHPIIYMLMTNGYATYRELRDELDCDDLVQLYEVAMVNLYNKNKAMEN